MVTTTQIHSAADFVDALRPGKWRTNGDRPTMLSPRGSHIFRGQANAGWGLLPSLARETTMSDYASLFEALEPRVRHHLGKMHWWGDDVQHERRASALMRCYLLEQRLLHDFAELCDELAHPIAEAIPPSEGALDGQQLPQISFTPTPVHAFAQHHGIPTLLLDWTWNGLVAAYFAAADSTIDSQKRATHLCVWTAEVAAFDETHTIMSYRTPRSHGSYVHAQHAMFLYVRSPYNTFDSMGRWAPFEEIAPSNFSRLTLPSSEAGALMTLLRYEGISHAHLMPTLDNIARSVKITLGATSS